MLTIEIDSGQGPIDYTRYVLSGSQGGSNPIKIEDSINIPTIASFDLVNIDNIFIAPVRGAYVRIWSSKWNRALFTGFVTNVPDPTYLGSASNAPSAGRHRVHYTIQATSDEYLLNIKSIPFLPAFISRTMGQILSDLANLMAPNFFDTTLVADGETVPFFEYDPLKKWSDIAKEFGDAARFHYKVIDRKIIFQPYGDDQLGITYDETGPQKSFEARGLKISVLSVPPVNDAIVIGQAEPQDIRDDYFIGDGITAQFPLRHSIFGGETSVLMQEDWTGNSLSQNWVLFDPQNQISFPGSLSVVGVSGGLGQTYVQLKNGIELGGHLALEHGEFFFADSCRGILGGVYQDTSFSALSCILGFDIRPSTSLNVTISGAGGLQITPMASGALLGSPMLTTVTNHHYILKTYIHARRYARFNQVYRSLAGTVFGGQNLSALADITFEITDIDLGNINTVGQLITPAPVTRFTLSGQSLPSFALYAIINAQLLNLSVNYTLISRPPQALLSVAGLAGATGLAVPLIATGAPVTYPLGFGIENQVATVVKNGDTDALQFYRDTAPSAGARVRLTSWESGAAIARVQDPNLIAAEAVVVGDDGLRTAIFQDWKPTPRTSEECELAAQMVITDRALPQYDGSYTVYDYFWNAPQADYPMPGRFLYVNAPSLGVSKQNLFVRRVSTQVLELFSEVLTFQVEYGQDLFLEKLLKRFIPTNPPGVLESTDAATPPLLQYTQAVGNTFLDNLINAKVTNITGSQISIDLGAPAVTGVEVRRSDVGWGFGNAAKNLIGVFTGQTFTLQRQSIDQSWFLRQVNGAKTSRFSRVFRVAYPLVPTQPSATIDTTDPLHPLITVQLNGDIRNVRGIEIRASDNSTKLFQRTFGSAQDLVFRVDNSVNPQRNLTFFVYAFNLLFEYSPGFVTSTLVANPPPPNILLGNPLALSVQFFLDQISRNDISYTTVQVDTASGFGTTNLISVTGSGQPANMNLVVAGASGMWVRAKRTDLIGAILNDCVFSLAMFIGSGGFVSSQYLVGQGSIPPTVVGASPLFTYTSNGTSITWSWSQFQLQFPSGFIQQVPSGSINFSGLAASTTYTFYPYVQGAGLPGAYVVFLGPYTGSNVPAVVAQNADGRVSCADGGVTGATTSGGAGSGGGGGTSGGNGHCVKKGTEINPLTPIGAAIIQEEPWDEWIELRTANRLELHCVPEHPVYTDRGKVEAKDLVVGDTVVTRYGISNLVAVRSYKEKGTKLVVSVPGKLFWANRILGHNKARRPVIKGRLRHFCVEEEDHEKSSLLH